MKPQHLHILRVVLLVAVLAACSDDFTEPSSAAPWELHELPPDQPQPELVDEPDPKWSAEIYARRDAFGFFSIVSDARGAAAVATTFRLLELRVVFTDPPPSSAELDVWVEGSGIERQRATSWTRPRPDALDVKIPLSNERRLSWVRFTFTEK